MLFFFFTRKCFRPRLGSVRGNLPLVWNNLVLHPTRQREGFAGRTSPGAAFTAAGTLVLHGPRSSAVAVVWESVGYAVVVGARFYSCFLGSLRSQEKQALKIVRFQRHLPLTIQFYISCRISGVPPLQSDFSGLSSALKDNTIEPKKRKETRSKPTKVAREKVNAKNNTYYN